MTIKRLKAFSDLEFARKLKKEIMRYGVHESKLS